MSRYRKKKNINIRTSVMVDVNGVVVVVAPPFNGAAVKFTKLRPQEIESCWAAVAYVFEMGCVALLPY
jgi:hypothetical protein